MNTTRYNDKQLIIYLSTFIIFISICIFLFQNSSKDLDGYALTYETINIKTMGTAKVSQKKSAKDNIFSTIVSTLEKKSDLKETTLENLSINNNAKKEEKSLPKITWRLPTEQGYITQYAYLDHIALDITSARGTGERIYPVADGVVSSIYYDQYGAKIVTVNHLINNQNYTSQYVHLSWFASELHVGQTVTTDTVLGGMGSTGLATGVHLHLTVMDCSLYKDANCSSIGDYLNYGRMRVRQGFTGLDSLMNVPYSWYSR